MALVRGLQRPFWQYGEHYDWLSGYLAVRGFNGPVRALMGLVSGVMTVSLAVLLIAADGPRAPVAVAMTIGGILGGVGCAALWLWRWPTYRQSLAFAVTAKACIALGCLAYPQPLPALVGCIGFATVGAYAALFHSVRVVVGNFAVATAVAVYCAVLVAGTGHVATAVVDVWLVVQINAAMPLAIHVLVRALSGDLLSADRDPLTGLFNRRAFRSQTLGLIVSRPSTCHQLVVAMVDLDGFKSINDAYGHTAGDVVLMNAARALREAAPDAVVARSGGEEFLIAHVGEIDVSTDLARRLCTLIAASAPAKNVTASIGTASTTLHGRQHFDFHELIDELVTHADKAMYGAKRAGGNGSNQHRVAVSDDPAPGGHH